MSLQVSLTSMLPSVIIVMKGVLFWWVVSPPPDAELSEVLAAPGACLGLWKDTEGKDM